MVGACVPSIAIRLNGRQAIDAEAAPLSTRRERLAAFACVLIAHDAPKVLKDYAQKCVQGNLKKGCPVEDPTKAKVLQSLVQHTPRGFWAELGTRMRQTYRDTYQQGRPEQASGSAA